MECSKCRTLLIETYKFCPKCGTPITNREIEESGLAIVSMILGIFGIVTFLFGLGMILGIIALILGIKALRNIRKSEGKVTGKGFAVTGIVIGGILTLLIPVVIGVIWISIPKFKQLIQHDKISDIQSDVASVQDEEKSVETGLESYYAAHHSYPLPDYNSKGKPMVPHVLTTPIAYLSCLCPDNFSDDGDYFIYGVDTAKGWIIISYGPDRVSGNSHAPGGSILDEKKALTDDKLGFPLQSSGLTSTLQRYR